MIRKSTSLKKKALLGTASQVSLTDASTKGRMWGYPVFVLGAVCSFLEPFRGHLSPNIDNVSEKLTFEIPPRRALGGVGDTCDAVPRRAFF